MNRRTALKLAAGGLLGGGAGAYILTSCFKTAPMPAGQATEHNAPATDSTWKYHPLSPEATAGIAYSDYSEGSCMYGVFNSIISQLAEKIGEPYKSFPTRMMVYGHGGAGGFGTLCGTLNGAAAAIGLFVPDKETCDALITDLFRWYERTPLPEFMPVEADMDFTPPSSTAESTLCHASMTKWSNTSGHRAKSRQRKERCRRLTADVAARTVCMLNQLNESSYKTVAHDDETVRSCLTCHGKEGKVGNAGGRMNCTSCHSKSLGHRLFADVHYKVMDKKE